MKIKISTNTIPQRFSTNGVLRCLSGEFPAGKTEKELQDVSDVIETVQKVFNYSDKDILDLIKSRNPLSTFLVPISAGRFLEEANPILSKLKARLSVSAHNNNIENEINKIIGEIGENINLKV